MEVIILGAGRIGRGFVTQIMKLNGVKITYFDASEDLVSQLSNLGSYTIHVLGSPNLDITHNDFEIYHISNIDELAKKWSKASFIFTACGGKNMSSIGKVLGETFSLMKKKYDVHQSTILTCENWIDPATDLKNAIISQLTENEKESFEENVGVGETVILCTGTGAPDPTKVINPMDTWIQNFPYLPVEKIAIKGTLPDWEYVDYIDDFGNLLTQKLYTNNTSCGCVAYLGRLLGKKYMAEAANDEIIAPIMDQIYEEINGALIKGMGIDEESQFAFSKRAKAKYKDKDIIDELTRIARDPLRKLRPNDRLIGPSQIALKVGIVPEAIALCTAAAIFYRDENDDSAVELEKLRREKGVGYILAEICQLNQSDQLYKLIVENIKKLQDRGWLQESINW